MVATASRRGGKARATAAPRPSLTPREAGVGRARQDFLDALPVAAAVVALEEAGGTCVQLANDKYRRLAEGADAPSIIQASRIDVRMAAFLREDDAEARFEVTDG